MSNYRGKSHEANNRKLNLSLRSPKPKSNKGSLKSKIAKVIPKQYESRLKTLQMIRDLKSQSSTEASQVIRIPTNDAKKIQLSSSFQTDFTNIDLSSIENTEILKSDSQRKLLSQNIDKSLIGQSPLRKILEIEQDLEKTPGFKKSASSKKKRNSSTKKKTKKINKENQKSAYFENSEPMIGILANQEKIFRLKLSELNSEHDKRMKILEDRVYSLKKDNEKLLSYLEGRKNEVKKRDRFSIDYLNDYESLLVHLDELKDKNQKLERSSKNSLCSKCKAFVEMNNDLMNKIGRIKEYINSD